MTEPQVFFVIYLPGGTLPPEKRPSGSVTAVFEDEARARAYAGDVRGVVVPVPIIADYRPRPQQETPPAVTP